MSDDWYRSPAWGKADQEHFETKLQRARPSNRPQYIRLKAVAVAGSKRRQERQAAAALLQRVIREHADDELQFSLALADLGRFYAEEGQYQSAADAYRACLEAEATLFGGALHTGSELALAEVIVRAEWADRYPEALELLAAADSRGFTFNSERWRWCVAHARVASRSRKPSEAAAFATSALALLDDPAPDFPRHPGVGLIDADRKTVRELERLIAR